MEDLHESWYVLANGAAASELVQELQKGNIEICQAYCANAPLKLTTPIDIAFFALWIMKAGEELDVEYVMLIALLIFNWYWIPWLYLWSRYDVFHVLCFCTQCHSLIGR